MPDEPKQRAKVQGKAAPGATRRRAQPMPAASIPAVERVQPSYVQVAAQLRSLILGQQLLPGERLPAEGDLSASFGVSRSTTREALRLLAAESLIESRRGVTGGAFVSHPETADIERALSTAVNLALGADRLTMDEVFEMWQLTQTPAAALAAQRRTDDHVRRLFGLSEPVKRGVSEAEMAVRGINFHGVVLEAAGNRLLQMCARPINVIGAESLTETDGVLTFVLQANERHRRIAEAIADQDPERAATEMAHDMEQPSAHRQAHVKADAVAKRRSRPT